MRNAGRWLGAGACVVVASSLLWAGTAERPTPAAMEQPQAEPRRASSFLPEGLAVVVTVRDGAGLVAGFHRVLDEYRFDETAAYQALAQNPGFVQARIGVLGLAAAAQTDAWTAAGSLAGDEMVFGLTPGKGPESRFIAVTVSKDPGVRDRFLDQVRIAAGLVRSGKPDPKRSRTIDGVTVFETENSVLHGQAGPALIVSNSEGLFRAALKGGSATVEQNYRRAGERIPADAAAWLWVDVAGVRAAAGDEAVQALVPNPLGGLLFGGAWRSILDAPSAVAWLNLSGRAATLSVDVAADRPLPETHAGFISGSSDGPGFDPAKLPGYLGDLRITRDWAKLFAERESLLALPAVEQLVAFSNGLTTLMGQMDFVDDVLPRFLGPVYLVSARQDLSPRGYRPTPALPAFALVMPLKAGAESDGFSRRLYSASVMAVSAGNLIATQQGQPAFIIDPDRYRDCRIVTAEYADPAAGEDGGMAMRPATATPAGESPERVNVRYNFAPAVGIVGDRYVIATSVDLLHTVIDGLLAGGPAPARVEGDSFVLDGPALAAVFADNREELVAKRMLDENRSRVEAQSDIDAFFQLLGYARGLSVDYRQAANGFSGSASVHLVAPPAQGK